MFLIEPNRTHILNAKNTAECSLLGKIIRKIHHYFCCTVMTHLNAPGKPKYIEILANKILEFVILRYFGSTLDMPAMSVGGVYFWLLNWVLTNKYRHQTGRNYLKQVRHINVTWVVSRFYWCILVTNKRRIVLMNHLCWQLKLRICLAKHLYFI